MAHKLYSSRPHKTWRRQKIDSLRPSQATIFPDDHEAVFPDDHEAVRKTHAEILVIHEAPKGKRRFTDPAGVMVSAGNQESALS